ncbi:hypothetical protein [Solibacillus sp. FSL K6-1523]|uniref:hypothetical protein n=1 Tax=Solibacillus sp. FSL K6-1523 TaxID=2921471 RepID=UPI0030FC58C3
MAATQQVQQRWTFEKTTLYNHKLELLVPYSKFSSGDQFNVQWEMIMSVHKKRFTKLQIKVLKVVRQRAFKVPGVSNASYRTYMEDCKAILGHDVSRDTIRDTLDKAEEWGILIKCAGQRMIKGRGSKTANVIIFNTYNEVYAYKVAQEKHELEEAKKLLAAEYKQAQRMMGIYNEAIEMAAEQQKQPKKEQEQPKKERKEQTLYQKLKNAYKPSNDLEMAKFKELVAIVYNLMKKNKEQHGFNHNQLEQIMLSSFHALLNKEGVNNPPAMLSIIIRKKIENLTKSYTSPNASKTSVMKEIEPEWFSKRNERMHVVELSEEEQEQAKARIMEKLNRKEPKA